jgi:hypothetical protein
MKTADKYQAELAKTLDDIDRAQGKVIRWVNKLSDLRARAKRQTKMLANAKTPPPAPAKGKKPAPRSKAPKDPRFANLDID